MPHANWSLGKILFSPHGKYLISALAGAYSDVKLGHHLLRHADGFHLDLGGDLAPNVTGGHPGYDWRSERAANEFAANLLMPASMVKKAVASTTNVATLASRFGVSPAAMGFRLKALRVA